jgi:hypothetical protein
LGDGGRCEMIELRKDGRCAYCDNYYSETFPINTESNTKLKVKLPEVGEVWICVDHFSGTGSSMGYIEGLDSMIREIKEGFESKRKYEEEMEKQGKMPIELEK